MSILSSAFFLFHSLFEPLNTGSVPHCFTGTILAKSPQFLCDGIQLFSFCLIDQSFSSFTASMLCVTSKCWNASRLSFGPCFSLFVLLPLGHFTYSCGFKYHLYADDSWACSCSPDLSSEFYLEIRNLWLRLHGCKTKFWLSPLNPFSFQLVDPDTPNCTSQKLGNHLTSSLSPSSPSACLINSTIHTSQVSSLLFVCISPLNYYHFSTGKLLKFPNWSFCFHFCLLYTVLLTGGTMFYEKHNHIM